MVLFVKPRRDKSVHTDFGEANRGEDALLTLGMFVVGFHSSDATELLTGALSSLWPSG